LCCRSETAGVVDETGRPLKLGRLSLDTIRTCPGSFLRCPFALLPDRHWRSRRKPKGLEAFPVPLWWKHRSPRHRHPHHLLTVIIMFLVLAGRTQQHPILPPPIYLARLYAFPGRQRAVSESACERAHYLARMSLGDGMSTNTSTLAQGTFFLPSHAAQLAGLAIKRAREARLMSTWTSRARQFLADQSVSSIVPLALTTHSLG
jgi:hypothetical protein